MCNADLLPSRRIYVSSMGLCHEVLGRGRCGRLAAVISPCPRPRPICRREGLLRLAACAARGMALGSAKGLKPKLGSGAPQTAPRQTRTHASALRLRRPAPPSPLPCSPSLPASCPPRAPLLRRRASSTADKRRSHTAHPQRIEQRARRCYGPRTGRMLHVVPTHLNATPSNHLSRNNLCGTATITKSNAYRDNSKNH